MEKRIYSSPQVEAVTITTALMITGPASVLPGPGSQAPERRVPTLGNDSVQVF